MTIAVKKNDFVPSLSNLKADMLRYGVAFEENENPDDGNGGVPPVNTDPLKPGKKEEPPKQTPPATVSPEDLKKLQDELAATKQRLSGYGDATPDEVAELRKIREKAENERKENERKAKEAEEKRLRDAGDFEALRRNMAEEHEKERAERQKEIEELRGQTSALQSHINEMKVGDAFGNSNFLKDETILSTSKARKLYGDHFEIEDGVVVAYDKPRGSANRGKIVDSRGNAMSFEESIKRIVDADADKDTVLKAKQRPGSGTRPGNFKVPEKEPELRGLDLIRENLAKLRESK